jgi:hypothetical protein
MRNYDYHGFREFRGGLNNFGKIQKLRCPRGSTEGPSPKNALPNRVSPNYGKEGGGSREKGGRRREEIGEGGEGRREKGGDRREEGREEGEGRR